MTDRGVRIRLVVGATVFAAIAIGAALVAGRLVISTELDHSTESLARTDLIPFVTDLHNHPDEPPDPPGPGVQVGIQDQSGAWVIDTLPPEVREAVGGKPPATLHVLDRDGDRYWIVVSDTADTSAGEATLWAAREATAASRTLSNIDLLFLAGGLALVVLFAVASWVFVRSALRPVEEARRRERRFVADAAHELRTPIAGLRSQLALARRSAGAEAAPEMDAAERSAERLGDLASNLLELARLDEGGSSATGSAAELRNAFLAAVDDVRATPAAAKCVIEQTSPSTTIDARADIDPVSFGRIVRNLLANAVAAAGPAATIAADLVVEASQVQLTVADDGPGMSEDFLPRALERFARHEGSGSGLGLALVDASVRAAGGSVRLENTQPGLRVTVDLPLR